MQSEGKIAVVLDTHHYCCFCHHNLYCIIITNAVVVVTVLSSGCYYGITAKWFSVLWCCWLGIWPIKTSASLLLGVTAVPCGQPRLLKLKGMSSYGLPWRYWEQECLEIEDWGATGKYTFTCKMAVKVARLIVVCHNFWNLVFFWYRWRYICWCHNVVIQVPIKQFTEPIAVDNVLPVVREIASSDRYVWLLTAVCLSINSCLAFTDRTFALRKLVKWSLEKFCWIFIFLFIITVIDMLYFVSCSCSLYHYTACVLRLHCVVLSLTFSKFISTISLNICNFWLSICSEVVRDRVVKSCHSFVILHKMLLLVFLILSVLFSA